ncbi:hypothetical protein [Actinophytocola xanthii]|uniref:Uncharacterized protein n=1 Tax=Actinophytocola xanthii TaxID=1912961 RepID=A0A1Q8CQU3_9PSEU|nr:hypothetical protein [Actinophytocola xanthii]OLF16712.1 hypothetical protein BU204_15360 [Actinophytocola xanthii]
MSAERDELMRLVQDMSEDQVRRVLAELRPSVRPAGERPWPPLFFAIAPGDGVSIASEADELPRGRR